MPIALSPRSIEITYAQVAPHIQETARQFCARYGKPEHIDEYCAKAALIYCETSRAVPEYAFNNFPGYIRIVVWRRLMSSWRTESGIQAKGRPKQSPLTTNIPEKTKSSFQLTDMIAELGADAQICVNLIIDMPQELEQEGKRRGGSPTNFRTALKMTLKGMRWSTNRINKAMDEVREALK